jgi:hypothetical protein
MTASNGGNHAHDVAALRSRLGAVLDAVGPALAASERIELDSYLRAYEFRLAVEQAASFLGEHDTPVAPWVKQELVALAGVFGARRCGLEELAVVGQPAPPRPDRG